MLPANTAYDVINSVVGRFKAKYLNAFKVNLHIFVTMLLSMQQSHFSVNCTRIVRERRVVLTRKQINKPFLLQVHEP